MFSSPQDTLMINKTAVELGKMLRERSITSEALVKASLDQIDQADGQLRAFLTVENEKAMMRAKEVDVLFDKGDPMPPLAGIPIALKDNICVSGGKTTCASQLLKDYVSPYNATVVNKINDNFLIPVGKVNLDEFAMGSSTENSSFGETRNPWRLSAVPGGSSGGSAACVAARESVLSLGSDTGGSIRQPASFCGVVGLKPTYGRVSRFGLVAFASSLDQIGPIGRSVEDVALLLNVISGFDPQDSTSALESVPDFTASLNDGVNGLKIGVPSELFGDLISPEIKKCMSDALGLLSDQGATWSETSMSSFNSAVACYYILAPAEASANLARYDGVRYTQRSEQPNLKDMYTTTRGEGFGAEVQRRIILGTFVLSSGYYDAYYLTGQKVRTLIKQDFERAFASYDVLITPTTPTTAFEIGENSENPLDMYLSDISTIPVNMAGLPAISVPCGFVDGLPVGLQIIGKAYDESTILKVAQAYQLLTRHHEVLPSALTKVSALGGQG
jgi:aspartyl-tRNA(Asn)/glutamyl-tRNA(Gln) amidotransferase subunit A